MKMQKFIILTCGLASFKEGRGEDEVYFVLFFTMFYFVLSSFSGHVDFFIYPVP